MDEASVSPLGCISTVTGCNNNSHGYSLPASVPSERRGGRRAPAPRKPTQLGVPGRDGKEASSCRMNSASKPVKSHGRAFSAGIWTPSLNKHPPRDTDSVSLEVDTAPGAAGGGGPTSHVDECVASTLAATQRVPWVWESTGHDSLIEETHTHTSELWVQLIHRVRLWCVVTGGR